jgi:DNA-directed RNA polymerase subunit RPC12/RpoP
MEKNLVAYEYVCDSCNRRTDTRHGTQGQDRVIPADPPRCPDCGEKMKVANYRLV